MQQTETMLTNFTAGEVSPKLAARVDLARQENSCVELENFLIDTLGGAFKAPGTKFIAEVKTSSKKARLIKFVYSDQQAYVLEFGDKTLRFYKDQAQIVSGSTAYEIVTPYGENDLAELIVCQSADVMYLCHPDYPPYKLSRLSHTSWNLAIVDFSDGPYLPLNDNTIVTLDASSTTGTVTIRATGGNVFDEDMVGAYFRMRHSGPSGTTAMQAAAAATSTYQLYGKFTVDLTPYQISETNSDGSVFTQPYHYPWTGCVALQKSYDGTYWLDVATFFYSTKQEFIESEMGVYYRCYCKQYTSGRAYVTIAQEERWGVVKLTGITSAKEVTALVVSELGSTNPTAEWREGAWSAYRGYPRSVVFGPDDRLWFAGTAYQPLTLWGSWVGDYENMLPGMTEDDAALTLSMNSREASAILWLMNYNGIAVGTSAGEGLIKSSENTNPGAITAKSPPTYMQHSTVGAAVDGSHPIRVGSAILFLQRHRRQVRELTYNIGSDGFDALNLCQLAEHITDSGIKEFDFAEFPIPQLWCVRYDGEIAVLTYLREEKVIAWTRIVTDGTVESICTIPTAFTGDEGRDEVWTLVNRTIGGATKRYIEVLQSNEGVADTEDYWYLHSALDYDGSPVTSVSGLTHLAGKTVDCLADGFVLKGKTVSSSGVVALGGSFSRVIVGLPYTSTLQPQPLQVKFGGGTLEGTKKRITKSWLRLYKSLGGKIGPDSTTQDTISMRTPGTNFGEQIEPYTGDWEMPFPGGPSEKVDIVITHDQPLPFNLLGIVSKVVVYDQ